jgi:RNA polymerase sigma factor (sigma-70 family)
MSSAATLTEVIRQLRPKADTAADDPELLDRYASGRDQAAFAALVERYGALVLGVARRQLADRQRAEDVFQATFLALARSATKLGRRATLANWLYTVALRQARKTRARAARRESVEHAAPPRPQRGGDPLDEITGRELLRAIDEELARLPDRLRLPVLLCCVQGLSREEAARQLGWSDGSVKGRLERGRGRLAARLAARGLAPSALVLAPIASVVVPAELLARTVELAASPWSKAVPPAVATLATTGAPRTFLPAMGLVGCVAVVGLAGWALAFAGKTPVEPASATLIAAAPVPPAKDMTPDPLPEGAILRFGTSRFRHGPTIETLKVSADGKVAVASSGTRIHGGVRAYDLTTGRVLFTFDKTPGEGDIEAVAFSPDGKTLATKRNFSVYLHDATTGKETARIEYPKSNPYSTTDVLAFSPDGKRILVAAAEGKALHLLDVAKREVIRTLPHAHVVFVAAFSPDGKHVAGGGYDSDNNVYFARLWDANTGQEARRFAFGNGGIRCLAFSADGSTLVIGGDGGSPLAMKLFDVKTGKEMLKIAYPDASSVRSVAFTPDGKTVAASGGTTTRLFDTATGKEKLKIDRKAIGLRFVSDGASLVGAVAGAIHVWDAATGKPLTPEGGDSVVGQIEVSADGKRMVTRGQDGDSHVWDAATDEHLRRVDVGWQRGLALSPDGRFLVWPVTDEKVQFKDADQPSSIFTGNRLRMLDLTTGKFVERFGGFEGDAHDLFFTAGGETLVTVDHRDAMVRFWDVATGKVERSFRVAEKARQHHVWHSRLSPDGKVMAVTYQPSGRGLFSPFAVKLWDTATGKELHDLAGHRYYVEAMAFSADGKYLVTGSEPLSDFAQERLKLPPDQVFVWDVGTGKAVARLPIGASAGAFSADGKTLAVATPDGTIQLWDVATWKVRGEFRGPRERVTALTFGPAGQLFSGSLDTTVLAWDPRKAKRPAANPPADRP